MLNHPVKRRGQVQPIRRLGDDIRGKLIRAGRSLQRGDRGVEVAMLLLQVRKLRPKLAFFLFCHRRLVAPGTPVARS